MRQMLIATAAVAVLACNIPPPRSDRGYEVRGVEGIEIAVSGEGLRKAGWQIAVKNTRDESVRLVWDESSYVTVDGISAGRMLNGETRVINSDQAQPATPIPPGSTVVVYGVPQGMTTEHGLGYQTDDGKVGVGRMYLVFESDTGKATWEGAISFGGAAPPPVIATDASADSIEEATDAGALDAGVDAQ